MDFREPYEVVELEPKEPDESVLSLSDYRDRKAALLDEIADLKTALAESYDKFLDGDRADPRWLHKTKRGLEIAETRLKAVSIRIDQEHSRQVEDRVVGSDQHWFQVAAHDLLDKATLTAIHGHARKLKTDKQAAKGETS